MSELDRWAKPGETLAEVKLHERLAAAEARIAELEKLVKGARLTRNRFGGMCCRCGTWCQAGDGHSVRHKGRWRVQHADCVKP